MSRNSKYTYEKSRENFRKFAKIANADILEKLYVDYAENLTIDIAIFKGNPKYLILHISGTHGVEGFIGSEIQTELLDYFSIGSRRKPDNPTMIFVHGLNPYGMKYNRRVNENNVDLNRNARFDGSFEDKHNLYDNVKSAINPTYPFYDSYLSRFYRLCGMGYSILKNGFANSKRAMVTGTYNPENRRCLFYGGNKLERSHVLMRDYLDINGYLDAVENLWLIDVHTGMGKMGKDTMMVSSNNTFTKEEVDRMFVYSYAVCGDYGDETNNVTRGYDSVTGLVASDYPKLFKNLKNVISVTQEFGTYHNIWVALELILENQARQYGGKYDDNQLYRIFSPLHDREVEQEMCNRGTRAFLNCFATARIMIKEN